MSKQQNNLEFIKYSELLPVVLEAVTAIALTDLMILEQKIKRVI